jgi:hypothetical protein
MGSTRPASLNQIDAAQVRVSSTGSVQRRSWRIVTRMSSRDGPAVTPDTLGRRAIFDSE